MWTKKWEDVHASNAAARAENERDKKKRRREQKANGGISSRKPRGN